MHEMYYVASLSFIAESLFPTALIFLNASERITGRKARGLQAEEIGCKCQTFFNLSLKQQEETN